MKRMTKWIIVLSTAVLTVVGLNAALGNKYRGHFYHHNCRIAHDDSLKWR